MKAATHPHWDCECEGSLLVMIVMWDLGVNVRKWCDVEKLDSDAIMADGASSRPYFVRDLPRGNIVKCSTIATEQTRS